MIFSAVITTVIGLFSPMLALAYAIGFNGKLILSDRKKINSFYIVLLVLCIGVFLLSGNMILGLNLIVGLVFSHYLFMRQLRSSLSYLNAVISVGFLNLVYSTLRHFFLRENFVRTIEEGFTQNEELLENIVNTSEENKELFLNTLDTLKEVYINYGVSFWTVSLILGAFLGALLFSKKNMLKWNIKNLMLPYEIVYLVIVGLITAIIPQTRLVGFNFLLVLSSLFFIQGISILVFYWGSFFKRSKLLLGILIVAVLLNPYLLLLIVLTGLIDIWFDIRKIKRSEENNENNND